MTVGRSPLVARLGHIALNVANLGPMVDFYRDVLGFEVVSLEDGAAFFRLGGDHHTLALFQGEPAAATEQPFNHMAFRVRDADALRELRGRLRGAGRPVGEGIRRHPTKSFFTADVEGNKIELYADLFPDKDWTGVDYPGGSEAVDLDTLD